MWTINGNVNDITQVTLLWNSFGWTLASLNYWVAHLAYPRLALAHPEGARPRGDRGARARLEVGAVLAEGVAAAAADYNEGQARMYYCFLYR